MLGWPALAACLFLTKDFGSGLGNHVGLNVGPLGFPFTCSVEGFGLKSQRSALVFGDKGRCDAEVIGPFPFEESTTAGLEGDLEELELEPDLDSMDSALDTSWPSSKDRRRTFSFVFLDELSRVTGPNVDFLGSNDRKDLVVAAVREPLGFFAPQDNDGLWGALLSAGIRVFSFFWGRFRGRAW